MAGVLLQMTDKAYDQTSGRSVVHKQQDKIERFILNLDKDNPLNINAMIGIITVTPNTPLSLSEFDT